MYYSVKQLADMAGVSRRTLHYYDEISLLQPSSTAENGYRLYDEQAALRLQQILFYRELGFSLEKIREILGRPNYDLLVALSSHRRALKRKALRFESLIETIDQTILHLQGEIRMKPEQLFEAFDEETQAHYEQEALQRWDPELVRASSQRWKRYSQHKKDAIMQEGNQIYSSFAALISQDPASQAVQALAARWHEHLRNFYEPTPEILAGLGQAYEHDPAFSTRFAALHPDLPAFLNRAIAVYCQRIIAAA
jgi:DNA-binding transcriptional MerR regulator